MHRAGLDARNQQPLLSPGPTRPLANSMVAFEAACPFKGRLVPQVDVLVEGNFVRARESLVRQQVKAG